MGQAKVRQGRLAGLYDPAVLLMVRQGGFEPEQCFEVSGKVGRIVKAGGKGGLRQVHRLVNKLIHGAGEARPDDVLLQGSPCFLFEPMGHPAGR